MPHKIWEKTLTGIGSLVVTGDSLSQPFYLNWVSSDPLKHDLHTVSVNSSRDLVQKIVELTKVALSKQEQEDIEQQIDRRLEEIGRLKGDRQ